MNLLQQIEAEEIDAREAKQSKFILAEKSINKGIAAYGRI